MRWVVALLLVTVAGCGPEPSVVQPIALDAEVAVATCDEPVGGPFELPTATAVEAVVGYDAQLASAPLEQLPAELPLDATDPLERAIIAYMLETPSAELGGALDRDAVLGAGPLGEAVALAFLVRLQAGIPGVDRAMLRRGLQRFYACAREHPVELAGFLAAVYDFSELPSYDVQSEVKNELRRLSGDADAGVWIAQTIVDGQVRETEIVLSDRRTDGALDFVVYDEHGQLMDRSRFMTPDGTDISGAAPYVCMVCHSTPPQFTVDVVHPSAH